MESSPSIKKSLSSASISSQSTYSDCYSEIPDEYIALVDAAAKSNASAAEDFEVSAVDITAVMDDAGTSQTTTLSPISAPSSRTKYDSAPPSHRRSTQSSHTTLGKRKASSMEDTRSPQRQSPMSGRRDDFSPPEPFIIAYEPHTVRMLSLLCWGAKWEIARFISTGQSWDQVPLDKACRLKTLSNQEAVPQMVKLLTPRSEDSLQVAYAKYYQQEQEVRSPLKDLDREEEVLARNPEGCCLPSEDGWYGGKVHFTAKLVYKDGRCSIVLEKPVLGSSNRFSRRFGSKSFIRVKLPSNELYIHGAEWIPFFKRPFIIMGYVFRAFFAKEENVFLFRTNERVSDVSSDTTHHKLNLRESNDGMSLFSFIKWHNDLSINSQQPMAKWASRFALGLSNSVPGIHIAPENIHVIPDIVPVDYKDKKPPNECIMTDGCGLATASVLNLLRAELNWPTRPTAVQCRLKGSKGLLLLNPESTHAPDEVPRVWVRDSQVKISYPPDCDVSTDSAKFTIDVLRYSRLTSPSKLSQEIIINLAENGVPSSAITELMQETLKEKVAGLTTWSDGTPKLWCNVAKEGSVVSARLARFNAGKARAMGLIYDDWQKKEVEDEDGLDQLEDAKESSTAWWDDPVSGSPSSLEETVLHLLDAGFHPDQSGILRVKLREVVKKAINTYRSNFHIEVPQSCIAFIVPDPTGVLKAGEVHIKSSSPNLIDQWGNETDIILGDVLLTRHPCKLPTDVQKAVAVTKHELQDYRDVIVISTQGHVVNGKHLPRHLASMTGGGDYDGDTMQAFWSPKFVAKFKSAPSSFADRPADLDKYLSKNNERAADFLQRAPQDGNPSKFIYELQDFLLASLRNSAMVGKYSVMWEKSVYQNGYRTEETKRLAYLFCEILDGAKSGVTVEPKQFRVDNDKYKRPLPEWKALKSPKNNDSNSTILKRPPGLGKFIMDVLRDEMNSECNKHLADLDQLLPPADMGLNGVFDRDLEKPWVDAYSRAKECQRIGMGPYMLNELERIEDHVKKVRSRFIEEMRKVEDAPEGKGAAQGKGKGVKFTALRIEQRQDFLRRFSREFAHGPIGLVFFSDLEVARLKASFAYVYDFKEEKKGKSRFPWNVAFRDLGSIKAEAVGQHKTVSSSFYQMFSIPKGFRTPQS
ncbi:RNA-dependent RNA polymerase [Abortiporus biennis]